MKKEIAIKYKEILDKYFNNEEEVVFKAMILLQYIFTNGDDISHFEDFVKEQRDLVDSILRESNKEK